MHIPRLNAIGIETVSDHVFDLTEDLIQINCLPAGGVKRLPVGTRPLKAAEHLGRPARLANEPSVLVQNHGYRCLCFRRQFRLLQLCQHLL